MKLLGVYIDENLNFAGHISELCMRASQKVGMFVRLRNLIPCNAKKVTVIQDVHLAILNLLSFSMEILQII